MGFRPTPSLGSPRKTNKKRRAPSLGRGRNPVIDCLTKPAAFRRDAGLPPAPHGVEGLWLLVRADCWIRPTGRKASPPAPAHPRWGKLGRGSKAVFPGSRSGWRPPFHFCPSRHIGPGLVLPSGITPRFLVASALSSVQCASVSRRSPESLSVSDSRRSQPFARLFPCFRKDRAGSSPAVRDCNRVWLTGAVLPTPRSHLTIVPRLFIPVNTH